MTWRGFISGTIMITGVFTGIAGALWLLVSFLGLPINVSFWEPIGLLIWAVVQFLIGLFVAARR